ncbi:MAG TPA: hypothetical protein V6D14_21765 [Coleofasciculaceae cyanobacterium]|jgi:hypothetical protein
MFHYGQHVRSLWVDEYGRPRQDIGEIIGMQYGASINRRAEWYYLIRFLRCEANPTLVWSDDSCFIEESGLGADDTMSEE